MYYVGADLHKKSITFCVVELIGRKTKHVKTIKMQCCETPRIEAFFRDLKEFQVTVEATIGYDWFAALAEDSADRVVVAHAGKLRVIAESTRKTDKIDARILADFLAHDMIPEAWKPTPRVRQHRTLIRRRCKLQSRVTSIKNTIRALLTRYNADRADLFSVMGREESMETKLLGEERWVLDDLWTELDATKLRLQKLDQRLAKFALAAPAPEREMREVLASIPGVGVVTIETILAELGDWRRFRNADAVVAFAGLDPKVRISDGKGHDLKISKAGSPLLRWIMIQLAHRVKRTLSRWRRVFEQLSAKVGNKKATCAIARRLLLVIYAMLRDGKAYQMAAA